MTIQEIITSISKEELENNILYTLHTANTVCFNDINITLEDALIENLKPENIRKDIMILGVTGTYQYKQEE